jgi:hypothetical protein
MPEPTKFLVYDLGEVDRIITSAARAMAYQVNTDVVWEDHPNLVLDTMAAFSPRTMWNRIVGGVKIRDQMSGSSSVETNFCKFNNDFRSYRTMFMNNFGEMSERGPSYSMRYLTEKQVQARNGWNAMREKFRAADEVNAEVAWQLNKGIVTTFYTKFAADLAMNTIGAGFFGPVSFLANTLVSIGYTAACKVVERADEADSAEVVGWVDAGSIGSNIVGNAAQELTEQNEKFHQQISDSLNKRIADLSKEGAYQHGKKNVELLEKSMASQRRYLKNLDAVRSTKLASAAAKGASFVVGLMFMGPQIKTALTGDLRRMEGRPEVKSAR